MNSDHVSARAFIPFWCLIQRPNWLISKLWKLLEQIHQTSTNKVRCKVIHFVHSRVFLMGEITCNTFFVYWAKQSPFWWPLIFPSMLQNSWTLLLPGTPLCPFQKLPMKRVMGTEERRKIKVPQTQHKAIIVLFRQTFCNLFLYTTVQTYNNMIMLSFISRQQV